MKETFPITGLVGRELGFNRNNTSSVLNYKEKLTKLTFREEDRLIISQGNPIYSMEFCPMSTQPKILAVSDEAGGVTLIDTQTNFKSKVVAHHACHNCSLYSVTWSIPQPNLLATGASDQTVCVWEANTFQKLASYSSHSKTVRRVRFHPTQAHILGSCSRDGNILLWDLRSRSSSAPTNTIYCAHSRPSTSTAVNRKKVRQKVLQVSTPVTDFLFVDDNTLISCGATDSQIKFWDIRKTYKHLEKVEPTRYLSYDVANCTGYSGMTIDNEGNLYISTAKDDIIRFQIYNESTSTKPDAIYRRPSSDYSLSIGLSKDGRYLISGSVTPYACIWDTWDTASDLPFTQLEGTRLDVVSTPCALFSSNDRMKIVTGADDSTLTIWRFNPDGNTGATTYSSTPCAEIPLAPFIDTERMKLNRFIPKHKPLSVVDPTHNKHLQDLPNFVIDGQLPHVAGHGRKIGFRAHTWLANFSLSKTSKIPIKKTLKLKRKATPSSSSSSSASGDGSPMDKSTPKRQSGPRKKRQCLEKSSSSSAKTRALRKSMAACSVENDGNDSDSPSILKYFSPLPSPLSITPLPLRDIDISGFLDSS